MNSDSSINDNSSYISVFYDSLYQNKFCTKIKEIFSKMSDIDKGIKLTESKNENNIEIEINNKYYKCSISVDMIPHDIDNSSSTHSNTHIDNELKSEGIIIYASSEDLKTDVRIYLILLKFRISNQS